MRFGSVKGTALRMRAAEIAPQIAMPLRAEPDPQAAAAEFLIARETGLIDDDHMAGEIGEVLNGTVAGRESPRQVRLYKSLGHSVQDLAALTYVHALGDTAAR